MSKENLQDLLDRLSPHGTLILDPPNREFKGAVVIRQPVVIRAQGATIHAAKGPVLSIEKDGVKLHDLNIEVTGNEKSLAAETACALFVQTATGLELKNVCVRGDVIGIPNEDGSWQCPRSLRQDNLAIGREHNFKLRLRVPVPCRLTSQIDGLTIRPENFDGGIAEVCLHVEPLKPGIRIRGDIIIRTAHLARRITVMFNAARSDHGNIITGDGQLIYACDTPPTTPPLRPPVIPQQLDVKPSSAGPGGRRRSQSIRVSGMNGLWSPPVPPETSHEEEAPAPPQSVEAQTSQTDEQAPPPEEEPSSKRIWSPRVRGTPGAGPWSPTIQAGKSREKEAHAPPPPIEPPASDTDEQVPAPEEEPSSNRIWSPRVRGTPGGIFSPQVRAEKSNEAAGSNLPPAPQSEDQMPAPDEEPPSTPISSLRVAGKPGMGLWSPTVNPGGSENPPSSESSEPLPEESTEASPSSAPNTSPATDTKAMVSKEAATNIEEGKPARKKRLVQGKDLGIFGNDSATK